MSNWTAETINTQLENKLDSFKNLMNFTLTSNHGWAAEHDTLNTYRNHTTLNIDDKKHLDQRLHLFTENRSFAQTQLRAYQNMTPTTPEEQTMRENEIQYITSWLERIHVTYQNFLNSITIDYETWDEKTQRLQQAKH